MFQKAFLACCFPLAAAMMLTAAEPTAPVRSNLSAAAIVDKNVAARGGLQAWRAVHSMSLSGKLGAGGNQRAALSVPGSNPKAIKEAMMARLKEEVYLPFVMDLERPHKMRFELQFKGETAVQVFDGANGWKYRPFLNRRTVEPYTPEELKMSSMQADLDGPLVDYVAKGSRVDLDGIEKVNGRDNYKLKLTYKNGQTTHVWIDAQTFLETKIGGQPRRLDGTLHPVETYFSDYREVDGLQIPFLLETKVLGVGLNSLGLQDTPVPGEKTVLEKVVINPKLADSLFTKPDGIQVASNAR
ncbi:MAG: hypothetical protein JO028_07300 [Acidobacteriaceae bacterium]|nr:hypothetical protein [Acidobacteriaceae bacterium]